MLRRAGREGDREPLRKKGLCFSTNEHYQTATLSLHPCLSKTGNKNSKHGAWKSKVRSGVSTKPTPSGSCRCPQLKHPQSASKLLEGIRQRSKPPAEERATCSGHLSFSFEKNAVVIYLRQLLLGSNWITHVEASRGGPKARAYPFVPGTLSTSNFSPPGRVH